jgi:hypothetical protein
MTCALELLSAKATKPDRLCSIENASERSKVENIEATHIRYRRGL